MKRNQLRRHYHTELNPNHILRNKSALDIIGSLRNYILTHTDKLNDFTTGSALETLLEAIATELEMYYHLSITNIKGSIDTAVTSTFGINKTPTKKAYGIFIIGFREPLPNALQIPSGTQFSSSNNDYDQIYRTINSYNVPQGSTNFAVTAYCTQGGTYGNIPAEVVNRCDNLPDADSVTNPAAISTGKDATSLAQLKIQFREMIQALQRGTVQAVQYGAMEVPNITGAFVDESAGYVRVYCHDANGNLPRTLQKAVQENIINWRPAGVPVEILPVHKSIVEVGVTLDVPNQTLRNPELLNEVKKKITSYINNRQTSQDLVLNHIVSVIMSMDNLGINNTQVDMYVVPSRALVEGATVNSHDSILLNEHIFNKNILAPKDRAEFDDYVHTPGDRDNLPYLSNEHGDGYLTADRDDTTDTDGIIDNNLDSEAISPINVVNTSNLYSDAYKPMMASMSNSADSADKSFNSDSASSAIKSMLSDSSGITQAESAVASNIQSSLSTIDNENGISFNASSANSYASSYIDTYSSVQSSIATSNNSSEINSMMSSLSIVDSKHNISFNSSYAHSYAVSYLNQKSEFATVDPNSASSGFGVYQNNAQAPTAVSAGDAQQENKPMRILNRYMCQGNEILRAGRIVVNFNQLNQFNRE